MKKTNTAVLSVRNLYIRFENKQIVRGVSFDMHRGELHVIMGPNGSGKSTLTSGLMGHPSYTAKGIIKLGGKNITTLAPEERARQGLLLAFQNPIAVPGVTISHFLRTAYRQLYPKKTFDALSFHKTLLANAEQLHLAPDLLRRSLNDGFSGGEKKKLEMLQVLTLKPACAIFDEIDTGLDVDALKAVSHAIMLLQKAGCAVLIITHYQRILEYVKAEYVHILKQGVFVKEGGMELVQLVEKEGYAKL